jgi:spore coat polysaccharide biosynthesis protein SpsF
MSKSMSETVGIIQARLGSTRLPGKVLREVNNKPLLQYMIERLENSKYLNKIVIATTTSTSDDELVEFAKRNGYLHYRGSEQDVLDRFYKAGIKYKADVIVRFCSDCPLIDPHYVDIVVKKFLENYNRISIVCNKMPFTFPDGFDVEVCSMATLDTIWKKASSEYEREHVFPYAYLNPNSFPIINVEFEGHNLFHTHRFTLDYVEDFFCIKEILERLYDSNPKFGLDDILKLVEKYPEILEINKIHLPDKSVKLAVDPGHSPADNRIISKR